MHSTLKIGTWEAVATIGCISLIPILLTLPTYAVTDFGTATFLHNVYTTILTLIMLVIILSLYKNFSHMDIVDIAKHVGGKPLQIICGIILISTILILCILTFSEFTQNLQNVLFPDAPQEYISILFGIGILISVFLGIRGIFRTSSIVVPMIAVGFIFMFFVLFNDTDITNFFPVFGNGISNFFSQGFNRIARYEGIFYIFLITPYVKNYKKVGYLSFILSTFFVLPIIFLLVGNIPYPSITENYFPIFELTRLINLGRFIQRVESIFILLWLLATFIYLSLSVYFAIYIFQKIFDLQYSQRLIPCFTTIIMSICTLLNSFEIIIKIRNFFFVHVSTYVLYILPIILLIVANIKRRIECKKLIIQNSSF